MDTALQFRVALLAAGMEALKPEEQGVPVDAEDHLHREQRILQ
jgi:hypothetical protein